MQIELKLFEDKSGDRMYFNWGNESEYSDDSYHHHQSKHGDQTPFTSNNQPRSFDLIIDCGEIQNENGDFDNEDSDRGKLKIHNINNNNNNDKNNNSHHMIAGSPLLVIHRNLSFEKENVPHSDNNDY